MIQSAHQHQSANRTRTMILMLSFLGVVIGIGFLLAQAFGNPNILYGAVFFSILMNLVSYWFSDKVALAMSKAQPADPRQFAELHRMVENLAITAGIPKPRVYVIAEDVPNAFATGRNPKNGAVAVTQGLLKILDHAELEGVIAHELGHIKNRDILVSTMAVVLAGMLSIAADFMIRARVAGGRMDDDRGNIITLVIGLAISVLAPLFGSILRFAVSRNREYLADATGAELTRNPESLASALQKIHDHSKYLGPMQSASEATAHLFISNPFGAGLGKSATALFSTHPPAAERVKRLKGMVGR